MSEKYTPETKYYATHNSFERLVSEESRLGERRAIAEWLSQFTGPAVADKEAQLMREYRAASERDDEKARQAISEQLHDLDYAYGKYRHRARQRAYEMDQRPHEQWLDAADAENFIPVQTMIDESPQCRRNRYLDQADFRTDRDQEVSLNITGDSKHPIRVPVANIIQAEGFISWQEGRGGQKMGDSGVKQSHEVMAEYAARDTALPPVEHIEGFIQPNGIIIYRVTGGAHRAGAAVMRGDAFLETTDLRLTQIDRDYISREEVQ